MLKRISLTGCIALLGLAVAIYGVFETRKTRVKIGFVNTQRLMTGFKPAYEVEKEINTEEDQFKSHMKTLEDSLKTFVDSMSVRFDKADAAKKRQMQDQLAFKNQEINDISRAHARKSDEERARKMQGVYDKVNAFMAEYGKKEGYAIIFGTVQGGNILFGDGTSVDITQKVLDGINARYQ